MSEKMKVAVIGCGAIADFLHVPGYSKLDNVEIKYFCDIIPSKAEIQAKKYGSGIVVEDYHDILSDPEVKAVSVCTPNYMHAQISVDFLRAGKQVLCEKPAARTYAEVEEMLRAQHETGNMLVIGVVNRFNAAVNKIKSMIDAGELGEVYHVYPCFRRHRGIPGIGGAFTTKAISGGGALVDLGVHFLDIVMYCTGDPTPITVTGKTYSKLGTPIKDYVYDEMWAEDVKDENGTFDVDDFVTGMVRTSGPTITINGSWAQNIGENEAYIDFLGTKAGVRLWYGSDFKVYGTKDGKLIEFTPDYDHDLNMFDFEIASFVDAVINNKKLPSDVNTVAITSRMMQAIYDSSEAGHEITLN